MSLSITDWIAGASAIGTIAAVVAAVAIYKKTVYASARPVLVFSVKYGSKWQLQNVGNGPSIDVVVYELHDNGRVENATRCHPLAAGGIVELSWLKVAGALLVVYCDSHGNWFTTCCANNQHKIQRKKRAPAIKNISNQWLQEILADPDGSKLTEKDLEGKSWEELDILRNTFYAQHGQSFRSRSDLRIYFERQPWYQPVDLGYDAVSRMLTKRESYEAHFILDYQVRNGLTRPAGALISERKMDELLALEGRAVE